ncbi:hypothetical protein [Hankyongella ginsenosidimutans]|uniref:hypothetical protein n=1 Tax=Hankyongella ginsenosidimutans TaxID=1763828 RepID=UPI001CA326E7|nr:hypothetical protein [Hankyongella ginsenosidimutans]
MITSIEPDVAAAVQAALGPEIADARITPDALKVWRDTANIAAAAHAGFTYGAYVELKLIDVLEHLADLIGRLAAPGRIDPVDPALRERVQAWARRSGVLNGERPGEGVATGSICPGSRSSSATTCRFASGVCASWSAASTACIRRKAPATRRPWITPRRVSTRRCTWSRRQARLIASMRGCVSMRSMRLPARTRTGASRRSARCSTCTTSTCRSMRWSLRP